MKITRITPRKSAPQSDAASRWRDNPLVVAAVTGAACITFMGTVVVPLVTSHKDAQLQVKDSLIESQKSNLKSVQAQLASTEERLASAVREVQSKEQEKENLHKEIRRLQLESPFLLPSIYPKGLDRIRVRDSIDVVDKMYAAGDIDKTEDTYWSVTLKHPIFSSVTYYFGLKTRKISHILFLLRHEGPLNRGEIYSVAENAFGRPTLSYQKNHIWAGRNKESLVVEDDSSLLVYATDEVLPRWLVNGIEMGKIALPGSGGPQSCPAPKQQ